MRAQYFIVPMQSFHIPHVLAIEKESFPYPWSAQQFEDCIQAGYQCWVLEDQTHIVGYAIVMLAVDEAHLLNMAVAPAQRQQGIGRWFLSNLISTLTLNHPVERMLLEVRKSNRIAIHLYKALGFKQISTRANYYPTATGREDAILFALSLL